MLEVLLVVVGIRLPLCAKWAAIAVGPVPVSLLCCRLVVVCLDLVGLFAVVCVDDSERGCESLVAACLLVLIAASAGEHLGKCVEMVQD